MSTKTLTYDLSTISNSNGSATYGFSYSGGVLTPANKGKDKSYAYAKLTFRMPGDGTLTLGVYQSSEKNYDYGIVSNLDAALAYNDSADSTGVKYNGKGLDGNATIVFENVKGGSHFITVKYRKDGSSKSGSDTFDITSLVATYKPSATFDLSTLNLSGGTYDITVKAKGDLLVDSEPSDGASYIVTQSGGSN